VVDLPQNKIIPRNGEDGSHGKSHLCGLPQYAIGPRASTPDGVAFELLVV
jgi:hypothetical protein